MKDTMKERKKEGMKKKVVRKTGGAKLRAQTDLGLLKLLLELLDGGQGVSQLIASLLHLLLHLPQSGNNVIEKF